MPLAILSAIALSACASMPGFSQPPPDTYACVELEKDVRGYCFYTISEREFPVNSTQKDPDGRTWKQLKVGALILPANQYAKNSSYILSQCHRNDNCGDIGQFQRKDKRVKQLTNTSKKAMEAELPTE